MSCVWEHVWVTEKNAERMGTAEVRPTGSGMRQVLEDVAWPWSDKQVSGKGSIH